MEKGAQIGNNLSGKGIYIPQVDETPVPCPDGYTCTDCLYCTDGVNVGYFGLGPKSTGTDLINAMICHMKEQDREIEYLKQKLKSIENGYNW